jgi:hypothetical protein
METPPSGSNNQLPTETPSSVVAPLVVTCADVSKSDSGPPVGTARPATISEDDIKEDRQDLYRSGEKVGTATEFVEFDNGQKVVKEVAGYLRAMIDAAKANGVVLKVGSGFRTMAQQEAIVADKGLASQGGLAAAPGYSNHQNGIAIDFDVVRNNGKPFEWLAMNAWKYGFIRGVTKERWHWEYWGNWTGQEKPDWANGWHSPKTMFSIVKRVHACGEGNGGRYPMKASNWWSAYFPSLTTHSDCLTGGKTNSWIGYGNAHLPDKFDTLHPGWDTVAGASFSPFLDNGTAGVGTNTPSILLVNPEVT